MGLVVVFIDGLLLGFSIWLIGYNRGAQAACGGRKTGNCFSIWLIGYNRGARCYWGLDSGRLGFQYLVDWLYSWGPQRGQRENRPVRFQYLVDWL